MYRQIRKNKTNAQHQPMHMPNTKKKPIRKDIDKLFDRIAKRYDLLNRLLSFRQDVVWRKKLGHYLPQKKDIRLLDLATGTADILITLTKTRPEISMAMGMDFSKKMLQLAKYKAGFQKQSKYHFSLADAQRIPLPACSIDAITMGFGIRNVKEPAHCLSEGLRILKPGGRFLILEFSLPASALVRALYLFYFRAVLPHIGGLISGEPHAYRYLNQTVETFPYGKSFCNLMQKTGFSNITCIPMTFGIATIYIGEKSAT